MYEMAESNLNHGSASVSDLNKLANKLKLPEFPKEYSQFLVETNGGIPKNEQFTVELPNEKYEGEVEEFFGLNHSEDYSTLMEQNHPEYILDLVPENFLIIGVDGVGSRICINLNKVGYGNIYYSDHEMDVDREDQTSFKITDFDNVFLIADSFNDFFTSLTFYELFKKLSINTICENGDVEKLEQLLEDGLSPNAKDDSASTLAHICASENQIEMLALLKKYNASFEGALYDAVYSGSEEAGLYILKNNLEKDSHGPYEGTTWLHMVAEKNLVKIGQYLIENGADINEVSNRGLSPLAVVDDIEQRAEFEALLIKHGAKLINTN